MSYKSEKQIIGSQNNIKSWNGGSEWNNSWQDYCLYLKKNGCLSPNIEDIDGGFSVKAGLETESLKYFEKG